jgi:hypothetical protein
VDSPGNVITSSDFDKMIDLLDAHGARGFGNGDRDAYGEHDRWTTARAVFSCVPVDLMMLRPGRDKFVPVIKQHLESLHLDSSERSTLVIKGVAEQVILSTPALSMKVRAKSKRKLGISDVRALGKYSDIAERQRQRCATCGCTLSAAQTVELDHVVPFSFIGDIYDGSNWRLLCGDCNLGKHEFFSSWLTPDAWNWVSPSVIMRVESSPTLRARYSVLSTRGRCDFSRCGQGPRDVELVLRRRVASGLYVPSNLVVYCEKHADV